MPGLPPQRGITAKPCQNSYIKAHTSPRAPRLTTGTAMQPALPPFTPSRTAALAEAAHGADLFAVEAYTYDRPVRHLDYQTLRGHLGEICARRIVLTHMSAAMLSRLADAGLPAAYDGMTVDL